MYVSDNTYPHCALRWPLCLQLPTSLLRWFWHIIIYFFPFSLPLKNKMQNVQFCCNVRQKHDSCCAHTIWFGKIIWQNISEPGCTEVLKSYIGSIWGAWVKSAPPFHASSCLVLVFCLCFSCKKWYFALTFNLSCIFLLLMLSSRWCLWKVCRWKEILQGHPLHERNFLLSAVAQGLFYVTLTFDESHSLGFSSGRSDYTVEEYLTALGRRLCGASGRRVWRSFQPVSCGVTAEQQESPLYFNRGGNVLDGSKRKEKKVYDLVKTSPNLGNGVYGITSYPYSCTQNLP